MTANASTPQSETRPLFLALTGNPNCGKTTLFNALTGLRAKVGNYAGVTVERKEGRLLEAPHVTVLDLPGTYSLSPQSLDEAVSRDVLFRRLAEVPTLDGVVVVIDASNLERNLYYATQVIELGYPTILALNMVDVAESLGQRLNVVELARALGVPVVPMVASQGTGIDELRREIVRLGRGEIKAAPGVVVAGLDAMLPAVFRAESERLAVELRERGLVGAGLETALARLALADERVLAGWGGGWPTEVVTGVRAARARIEAGGEDWRTRSIEARYGLVAKVHAAALEREADRGESWSDRMDRVLTHKVWGLLIFVAVMALMFQSIFAVAQYPMEWLEAGVGWVGERLAGVLPAGDLQSLLVDGVVAGVGAVVVFLPQICLLFLFIGVLEDSGYMARAAFLMDRLMSRVGLHGKSFIPMLSSFACAIPGIMATRTIENPKDRLATILVAPLMSCSARLPVYTVLIAACIPDVRLAGMRLQGVVMLSMYLLGIGVALAMAWLFKRTLLKAEPPLLIMELPPYRRPVVRVLARHIWDRSLMFLRRAGTVILGISILLWFLVSYPRDGELGRAIEAKVQVAQAALAGSGLTGEALDEARARLAAEGQAELAGERLRRSYAGWLGHAIEPLIAPLGFDWKIGIGIVASFAAREVFVSTMSTVYNVASDVESEEGARTLAAVLNAQRRADGAPLYTPLLAVTLMVFYVFALQCVSTVAVVRRETNGWRWPVFQWAYMAVLAWGFAWVVWHGGHWLGFE